MKSREKSRAKRQALGEDRRQAGLPPLPVGAQKGQTRIKVPPADGTPGFGWVYNASNGTIVANTGANEENTKGKKFNTF